MIKSNTLIKAIFTVAYVAVIVPYSATFFRSISAAPILEGADYLNLVQPIMLMLLLGYIEFFSINFAESFWRNPSFRILMLFLCLQSLATTAVFLDVRTNDFIKIKDQLASSITQRESAAKEKIEALDNQLKEASSDIDRIDKRRQELYRSKANLLQIRRNTPQLGLEARVEAANSVQNDLEMLAAEYDTRARNKIANEAQLQKYYGDLEKIKSEEMPFKSEFEYIVNDLFSPRSLFALFIAAIFPISIFSAGYVFQKNQDSSASELNLQEYLDLANTLHKDAHAQYARLMVPAVAAQMSGMTASQAILRENANLNLAYSHIKEFLENSKSLQERTAKSPLQEDAKNYLLNEIEKIMNSKLTEVSHA